MGNPLETLARMGETRPPDAACDSQEMAHKSIPYLLALEVEEQTGSASYFQGDDGSDTKVQQGEPVVESGTDQGHIGAAGLRSSARGHDP